MKYFYPESRWIFIRDFESSGCDLWIGVRGNLQPRCDFVEGQRNFALGCKVADAFHALPCAGVKSLLFTNPSRDVDVVVPLDDVANGTSPFGWRPFRRFEVPKS